jgi:hypothetical protein
MARIRKRRRLRRKAPAVRRPGAGDLIVGGAKDPAEGAADHLAAKALAGGAHAQTATSAPAIRRSAPTPALAPGTASTRAPKKAANLVTSLGAGRALNAAERGYFEPRFGTDLSAVRLHEGPRADRATRALDAEAFAHGPDIAFARGKRDRATMAHELAHAVQTRSRKLRRKIATEVTHKKNSNLRWKLRHDYGVKGVSRSGNDYTLAAPIKSGRINTEIASSMLSSPRTFTLKGAKLKKAAANLRDHLRARRGVIKFSKSIRVGFSTSTDTFKSELLKFVYDEALSFRPALIAARVRVLGRPLKPEERSEVIAFSILLAFQKNVSNRRLRAAIRSIQRKSKAYDKLRTRPAAKPFIAACFSTTAVVMFGGGGAIRIDILKGLTGDQSVEGSTNWKDWVPGDWGYIGSPAAHPSPGREGENMIYVGKNRYWAHFGNISSTKTLPELFTMVERWAPTAGRPILGTYRKYPKTGLR